jgi:hypothetical protein
MYHSRAWTRHLSRMATGRPFGAVALGGTLVLVFALGWAGPVGGAAHRTGAFTIRPTSNNPPSSDSSLFGVSCSSATSCIAVGEAGTALRWHDGVWSDPAHLNAGGSASTVSCPTAQFCVAVSDAGEAVTYNGTSWSSPVRVGPAATYKVSCPSSTFCVAVGASGVSKGPRTIAILSGVSWTSQHVSNSSSVDDRLLGVSCVSPMFCVAVNLDGEILHYDGTHGFTNSARGPQGLISVACSSATTCIAVTSSGLAVFLSGVHWSKPREIPGFRYSFAYSVSCASSHQCSVLGLNGQVALWDKGRWSTPQTVIPGGTTATVSLSCVQSNFCLAVNSRGAAATY